ncbi:alpha/beta hydrolase family protein [Miniimonas arenae]|uniref:alpha/beta hydrolase family protein n=1 Tax=Miniimonas arenae TaxID=676201 RepID=UPI0015D5F549|nr:acetylxylan esterase [Miniimonas arenae]
MVTPVPTPPVPQAGLRPTLLSWLSTPRHALTSGEVNRAEALAWQHRARARLAALLAVPFDPVPLDPRALETVQLDGYRRTMLAFDTAPGTSAIAWWVVPDGVDPAEQPGGTPALIATPGHGIGARDLLAMDAVGHPRPEGEGYQQDYALRAVRLGVPTLVVEPLGFGVRRDHAAGTPDDDASECAAGSLLASMLGTSLPALRVNDLRRAVDLLPALGADPDRIGLVGISGGGQLALWTGALDPRIAVVGVSCYLNTFATSVLAMEHCACNAAPGLAVELDMPDLAALVAPRPLLVEAGLRDPIFPIQGTRAALDVVRRAYAALDATDLLLEDVFDGGHAWSGRLLPELLAHLQPRDTRPRPSLPERLA